MPTANHVMKSSKDIFWNPILGLYSNFEPWQLTKNFQRPL